MSATSFARVPHDAYDALRRGEITPLQFTILAMLHNAADWRTGIVKSWSAKQFFYLCGESKPTDADCKKMRRAQAELRARGWYHHDYAEGLKRPYDVTLHNFVVFGQTQANVQAEKSDIDQATLILNPHEVKSYSDEALDIDQEESLGQTQENVQGTLGQMSPKDHIKDAPDGAVLRTADAAGTIDSLQDSLLPLLSPAGGSAQSPHGSQSKASGKGKLLKALYGIAACELKNTTAVPASLKPRFDLIDAGHGFAAVVEDFTKWCRENLDRHPKYPLVDYVKIVDERLGVPSVPEAQSANTKKVNPADDSRVVELVREAYDNSGIAPDIKKVANLIAVHGFEYVRFAYQSEMGDILYGEEWTEKERLVQPAKFVKTFFSESGGLAIISDYKQKVFEGAVEVVQEGWKYDRETAAEFCKAHSATFLIILYCKCLEFRNKREKAKEAAAAQAKAATKS